MRNTLTRVKDYTCGTTRGVKRENCLHVDIEARHIEDFEHDLSHLLSVKLRVQRCFCHQDGVLFWRNTQFAVKGVMPHFFHVIPVGDDSVLDGVLNFKNTAFLLSLFSNIDFFLVESDHDAWHLGASYDSRED
jgi:hypothetical protein